MKAVSVIGIGPGGAQYMTGQAREALEAADVLCGYTVYVDLVKDLVPEKEVFTTGMKKETDRCRRALEIANEGRHVALVCSGDAGVYGMAGLVLELQREFPDVEVQVVPGITAALSGGAVLGAPLGHDFCVISLSDLLTPWELIEKRLRAAAAGDFCVAIYNPMSHHRTDTLQRACGILLEEKGPETVCGWVRNIGREGEECSVLTLGELQNAKLDMFTTVFVGSSRTEVIGGRMVTPRGYRME